MPLRGPSAIEQLKSLGNSCTNLSRDLLVNCYEFDAQDLATLLSSKDNEATAAALAFLWTDLRRESVQPQPLLHCAYARTATLLAGMNTWSNPRSNIHLVCERVFDALGSSSTQVSRTAPLSLILADVLTDAALELQSRGGLDWLTLANSCCAMWPSLTSRLFAFLEVGNDQQRSALEYICAVAYPTPDHPWFTRPFLPWWFYQVHERLHWQKEGCDVLEQLLSRPQVEARLSEISKRGTATTINGANVDSIVKEISEFQLDSDLPKRTRTLLHHLASGDQSSFWDDEVGANR
ncbi:MAG: hypothetical protein EOO73_09010 [Myxococcales bacterium]|nr:MAG: hypothetical protein EOO73_09010 [Myxococcales bacterium]